MRNTVFAIFSVLVFLFSLNAAGAEKELSGKWKCGSSVIEFSKNGIHTLKLKDKNYSFIIEGSNFLIQNDPQKTAYRFKLENNRLHVYYTEEEFIYRKK